MTNDKQTGGSAFPQFVTSNGGAYVEGGMTLRDYFAAKTMNWFLTKLDDEGMIDDHDLLRQFASEHAYAMADAMLEARK